MLKIEKGQPIPTSAVGKYRKHPFKYMEVGDSVFIEGGNTAKCNDYQAAKWTERKRGWKFTGRKVEGGIRIWRVS